MNKFTKIARLTSLRYLPWVITRANVPKLLLISNLAPINFQDTIKNIDRNLQEACDFGDDSIRELMVVLRENLEKIVDNYKECLRKQQEVIKQATYFGELSEKWDDLPKYRSLGIQLQQELEEFTNALNTIGQLMQNTSLEYITNQESQMQLIYEKYLELKDILEEYLTEIKALEKDVLKAQQQSIFKL